MSDYKKVQGIYKSRNILLELLKNANYNVNDYEGFNINEINTLEKSKLVHTIIFPPLFSNQSSYSIFSSLSIKRRRFGIIPH